MSKNVITIPDGKISDYIDGKFRNDTPEEYVRQTIEKRLVNELKYSPEQIKIEFQLQVGSKKPRADIVIWDKDNIIEQNTAKIIIECKKESVSASASKDGIAQLHSYMAVCPNCEWGMWTNSLEKFVFRKIIDSLGNVSFKEYNDIPGADGKVETVDRPNRLSLRNAADDNLLFVFRTCHNHIYVNEGLQKQPAFFELLKVIFCKIEDERNIPKPLDFFASSSERANKDGQLTVKKRISKIFERVKKKYGRIFESNDQINLSPRTLSYVVTELQSYSLLNTNIDIKGKAYEEIVGANLRGDRGEFFTPRNIMKMAVEMINPKDDERVLDSSCGTGGFIVTALTHVIEELEKDLEETTGIKKGDWDDNIKRFYLDKVSEIAHNNFFGFDINPDLVKATKMNMVMNNDGSGNVYQVNSLLPPHEWSEDFKRALAHNLSIDYKEIKNYSSLAYFDVIVTNPPFGSKIPIKDPVILEQYELAYIWERMGDDWVKTERLQSSVPPEILFIERCTQFLKPGGRMAIVLPDSILGSPSLEYIRDWLIRKHKIIASVDLHADTFQPRNGTQTSILILQKKTKDEIDRELSTGMMNNYNIFMSIVDKVGHDKRGNPIFVRDDDGEEVLVTEQGDGSSPSNKPHRILDDQTVEVPALFAKWKLQEGIQW